MSYLFAWILSTQTNPQPKKIMKISLYCYKCVCTLHRITSCTLNTVVMSRNLKLFGASVVKFPLSDIGESISIK